MALAMAGALLMTATALIFRSAIVEYCRSHLPILDDRGTAVATVIFGAILGGLVTVSSVGPGADGVCALIVVYPRLPMAKVVGSDIAHAVPLTLVAGAGHWMIGTVDWHIIASLLAGSLPGIILGSYLAVRVSEAALRFLLAVTLVTVAGQLLYQHAERISLTSTAFTRRAAH